MPAIEEGNIQRQAAQANCESDVTQAGRYQIPTASTTALSRVARWSRRFEPPVKTGPSPPVDQVLLAEAQPGAYALKRAVLLEKSFSCNPAVHVFEKLFPWNPPT